MLWGWQRGNEPAFRRRKRKLHQALDLTRVVANILEFGNVLDGSEGRTDLSTVLARQPGLYGYDTPDGESLCRPVRRFAVQLGSHQDSYAESSSNDNPAP